MFNFVLSFWSKREGIYYFEGVERDIAPTETEGCLEQHSKWKYQLTLGRRPKVTYQM